MFSPDIFTLLAGTLGGFVFKIIAQAQANRQAQFERMIGTIKVLDESADKAAARSQGKAGDWIRRLIVFSVMCSIVFFPFILVLIDKTTIIETQSPVKEWVFGLFSTGGNSKFYSLSGYLLSESIRQAFLCLIGFYFGQSSARVR